MNNKIFILLFSFFIFSCHSQEEKTVQNIIQKENEIEQEILSKFAKNNGYEKKSYKDFKDKCHYYLGILLENTPKNSLRNINENTEYQISEKGQYIFTEGESLFYQPNIEEEVTYEQAEDMLYNKENGIGEKFLAYNKLLFNDDSHSVAYFLQNTENNIEIVLNLDYEENTFLLEKALIDAEKNNIYSDNIENILFYNNKARGFKRMLISKIYERNKDFKRIKNFEILLEEFYKNYDNLKYSNEIKRECMVFLINHLIDFDKSNNILLNENKKSYKYLFNFLKKDKDLANYIQKIEHNHDIKALVKSILDINKFFIQDPDGYTNLRKEKSTKSEIIQQIKSGERIDVLDNSGDWFLIRTKEGKKGYIHKSRIKSDISKPISIHLYSRPDWNSFSKDIRVEEEIEYIHKVSNWDYVKIGQQLGYLPPIEENNPTKKHTFLAEEEDILTKKEKGFWDKLFG